MLGAEEPAMASSSSMVADPVLSRNLTICSDLRLMDSDISSRFYSVDEAILEENVVCWRKVARFKV
jgi:hypothetical protein